VLNQGVDHRAAYDWHAKETPIGKNRSFRLTDSVVGSKRSAAETVLGALVPSDFYLRGDSQTQRSYEDPSIEWSDRRSLKR
jgi:hypothetical protein